MSIFNPLSHEGQITDRDKHKGKVNLRPLLKEPDAKITVTRAELLKLCIQADAALDGDSNDAEHDALNTIRGVLSDFLEDPERR
jgi:hypothetical protein